MSLAIELGLGGDEHGLSGNWILIIAYSSHFDAELMQDMGHHCVHKHKPACAGRVWSAGIPE